MGKCLIDGCGKSTSGNRKDICEMHYYRMRRNGNHHALKTPMPRKIEFEISEKGCFVVTSHAVQKNGYFHIRKYNKRRLMHRFIYEECFGEIPKGLVVRHKCDNKRCINPEHLEIGTLQDNVRDAVERGLMAKGDRHPHAKLTEKQVREIKMLINSGVRNMHLAEMFKVDRDTISNIKTGKTWKHIKISS